MLNQRDGFLQRVRHALSHGQRTARDIPLPDRGTLGYQGGGDDAVAQFCQALTAAGACPHLVPDSSAATAKVMELLSAIPGNKILLGQLPFETAELSQQLRALGKEVLPVSQAARQEFFAADLAITGVAYLIAETGSIVVVAQKEEPRSPSLLPPAFIAVARRQQLLPDLFDLFAQWGPETGSTRPSCLTIITGPSKTGDIELKLVTGVHGPGVVHVILLDAG